VFEFVGLTDTPYTLVAAKPGYTQSSWGGRHPQVIGGSTEDVHLVLHALYGIRVIAVDEKSGLALRHALLETASPAGQPWTAASAVLGVPAEPILPKSAERGVDQTFFLSLQGDPTVPVVVRVAAPGYQRMEVKVQPKLLSLVSTMTIPLEQEEHVPLIPISFRAFFASRQGLSGECMLELLREGHRVLRLPLDFVAGELQEPIGLPPGKYRATLGWGRGSLLSWRRPLGKRTSVAFEVRPGTPGTVDMPLTGGAVLLSPKIAGGHVAKEFFVSVTNSSVGLALETWTVQPPFTRSTAGGVSGILLWLDAGDALFGVTKPGYTAAEKTMTVSADGSLTIWEPVLEELK